MDQEPEHNPSTGTPFTQAEVDHLLAFVGYGSMSAPVWFLGMEEAGGGESNLRRRLTFQAVEDCAEAHQKLGVTKHHTGKRVIQLTWRGMCHIMLGLEGRPTDRESIRAYQAEELGQHGGSSLLCELMPIPKPNIGSWDYTDLIPQYPSREAYYQAEKPNRVVMLAGLIALHRPRIVIGYGKSYWADYQSLFPGLRFEASGTFLVAGDSSQRVILVDHFTARSMNNRLEEVVRLASDAFHVKAPRGGVLE